MDGTNKRAIVSEFFDRFSAGDVDGLLDMMTDDAIWWVAGTIEGVSGNYKKLAFGDLLRAVRPIYTHGALVITPAAFTVEGDRVAMEATSFAELAAGGVYTNSYHFLIELQDGKLRRVKEYADTMRLAETFSPQ